MASEPKILCLAGSLRSGSYNKQLVKVAMNGAQAAGAQVSYIDLKDYPLPLYDGDIESKQGLPENAIKLKTLLKEHQAFLIASPEYNSAISGVLKNAIDWASRPLEGEKPLACFAGKVAGIMSASPGALGGLRGLVSLRAILENIHVLTVTEQVAVSKANEAFNEDGTLKDKARQESVENIGRRVADVTRRLIS